MNLKKVFTRLKLYAFTLWKLFWDQRTPKASKILVIVAFVYLIFPFDFVPDFIPLAGLIDEALIIPFLIHLAVTFAPEDLKKEFQKEQKN